MKSQPVLIVGGSGKTGGRVSNLLSQRGIATRPVSRSTTPAFDWTRPESWPATLDGIARAYVTYQPDIAVPGAVEAIAEFSRLAREKGVEQIVLLSGRGEPSAQRAEAALQVSGVTWTCIRASWFNQNFSEGYLIDGVLAGEMALPVGDVREPFVDADDIAEVAVAALTDDLHANRLYELTGPRALTFAEAIGEIATATKRPIQYIQITPEEFAASMRPHVPEDVIQLLNELFTVVLDGRNTPVASGVFEALGRPARDFSDYARSTAVTGVWSV